MPEREQKDSLDFVLVTVCHLHRIRAHQLLESLGLYQGQPPVLYELWREEGLTQSELAARMKIKPATLTKMLQRMQKTGFIERRPDYTDQRISRVFLTDVGREVKDRVEEVWKTIEGETFENLTFEERLLLRRLLLQMRQNLVNVTGEEPVK